MTILATLALPRWRTVCTALCLLLPGLAAGEEVNWRSDYKKAREEAERTGRPLFIDVGSDNCYWCKQLDTRTFTDAEVITLLNQRFIPLRINADHDPYYIKALRVQSYPTMVVAESAGKILRYQEGFVEADALKELLGKVLAAVGVPDWMARDFEEAGKAVAMTDYPRAISLLRNIVEDGKTRPVQQRARDLLQKLEQQASERLSKARELIDKGQPGQATEILNDLAKAYAGTQAAREGKQALVSLASKKEASDEERLQKARELLKRAREDYQEQRFLTCLDRCEELASQYADLPEGSAAGQLASEIKGNPEWTRTACDQLSDRLCVLYLSLAETWLKKGQPQQAIFYLERVIKTFPSTRHAEVAQTRLTRLLGTPTGAAEEKH
jgi:thioredoxin-like negative regulator of GroEL